MDMQKLAQLLAEAEAGDLLACADLATRAPALGREVIALRAEIARLRSLIAGLDPDHFGLQARVVALRDEALREGGA